jgi:hypothetical protein
MQDQIERDMVEGIGSYYGLRHSHSAKELLEALEHAVASADQCEILELVLIAMAELGKIENSPPVCHLVERAKAAWLQRLGMVSSFS